MRKVIVALLMMLGTTAASEAAVITYSATPFTGDPATATVSFDDSTVAGSVQVTIAVTAPTVADIRGLFLNITDTSLLPGLSITGAAVTDTQFGPANGVDNLGGGNNINPSSGFDLAAEIGTSGIGTDDIATTTFLISHTSQPLTNGLFTGATNADGYIFGLRLTSVGVGAGREGSSKLRDNGVFDGNDGGGGNGGGGNAGGNPIPEPATLAVFGGIAVAGAFGYRRRKAAATA